MTVPPTVPPPGSGLGSNSNYILSSDCNPIVDLSVTINVTEEIVSFQLNAYSPAGETSAWQQYVFCHSLGTLTCAVDNFPLTGPHIIMQEVDLAVTPDARTLPAGYQLQISLKNDGWRNSWDLAVSDGWGGPGNTGLLLYDRAAGAGAFYAVDSQAAMTLLAKSDSSVVGATFLVTGADGRVIASETTLRPRPPTVSTAHCQRVRNLST